MKKISIYLRILILVTAIPSTIYAADPLLYFSDIINGPKSGLGDSLGEGAIVTLWGKNLGYEKGDSKVYLIDSKNVTHEMAYVYYWENANPDEGLSGPSDMWTYHKMQEIACSIPSASADGPGKIYIKLEGEGIKSNKLDFYVRSNGSFYFVSLSGNDSANGSWENPKATLSKLTRNDSGIEAGDIIYAKGNYNMSGPNGLWIGNSGAAISGEENNNIAVSVYPGGSLKIEGTGTRLGINNYSSKNNYWVISKVEAFSAYGGVTGFANGRLIGLNLHGCSGVTPMGSGALIDAGANFALSSGVNTINNLKVFGNYLHDFGTPASNNNLLHTMYFRIRSNTRTLSAPEIAWNYLHDKNGPRFGIHYYDEGSDSDGEPDVGSFVDTLKIHNNVVCEQTGAGINIGTLGNGDHNADFDIDIYNNLLIDCGRNDVLNGTNNKAIKIYGGRTTGHIRIFNNTIYGYGDPDFSNSCALYIPTNASCLGVNSAFGGTYELRNNIFVDTNNIDFIEYDNFKTASASTNNIWYSSYGNLPPSGDTDPITSNPMLNRNYIPSTKLSPAAGAGYIANSIFIYDFLGILRGTSNWEIGAFEINDDVEVIAAVENLRIKKQ